MSLTLMSPVEKEKTQSKLSSLEIFRLEGNGDGALILNYFNGDEFRHASIRFYSHFGGGEALDTLDAIKILMQIENNPTTKLQFTEFIDKAFINIEEGTVRIYYDKKTQLIKLKIHKYQENGTVINRSASVYIALKGASPQTDKIVIFVSQEIFKALANVQNTMKIENQKLKEQKK